VYVLVSIRNIDGRVHNGEPDGKCSFHRGHPWLTGLQVAFAFVILSHMS
jgi:hypothetical protein